MTREAEPTKELPILQAHDVIEVNVVAAAEEGGERLIAVQISRLRIAFAMSLQDAQLLGSAVLQACATAEAMNAQDAAGGPPKIILPVTH